MSEKGDLDIVMRWTTESYVSEYLESDDFIYETSGKLFSSDDNDERKLVGKFRTYYVDVERAIDEGEPIFEVLDAHSSHLVEYFEPLFGSEAPDFSNHLLELLDHEVIGNNLLILDRLEILPQYRGKGLGLSVLRHMIARLSFGASLVALKPFPLQFETTSDTEAEKKWRAMLRLDQLPTDEDAATEKLCQYYKRLGFRRLSGTPMMVMSTARPFPSIEDV